MHEHIVENGLQSETIVGSTIVDMYAKCGDLPEACNVFDNLTNRNVVSWGIIISAYAQHGKHLRVLECLEKMQKEGIMPNLVLWNSLIGGYAQHGEGLLALECFKKMQQEGIEPDSIAYLNALRACVSLGAFYQGRIIHNQIIQSGLASDVIVGSTLVNLYSKCGKLEEANQVFQNLSSKDVVSWDAMIAGYAQHGEGTMALKCFEEMQQNNIEPDKVTFLSVMKACSSIQAVDQGRLIHKAIIERGFQSDPFVGSTLVDMYAKCGHMDEAAEVFSEMEKQNVVSWGALILGYVQCGEGSLALECFNKMQQEDVKPDEITFLNNLKACASTEALEDGRLTHGQIIEYEVQSDVVIGSTLVNMYGKCGALLEAQHVFEKLLDKDIVSWGAMISGYAQHGQYLSALAYFNKMQEEGVNPNAVVCLSILKACASIGALDQGRAIHEIIARNRLPSDFVMENTLVDMYAKCGNMTEACEVFSNMKMQNVVSWCTMIAGYAQHGESLPAIICFEHMQQDGVKPNEISLTAILTAYNRAGLVDEGRWYFKFIVESFDIMPTLSHYTCMVDLLGHAGYLDEAEHLIRGSKQTDIVVWKCLFNACKMLGSIEVGKHCFDQIIRLDPHCGAGYIIMSNIYANAHMFEDACKIENMRRSAGAELENMWEVMDENCQL